MTALISTLLASLPNVFLAIISRLVTEKFMTKIVAKVTIYGLKKAAKMTTNTVDDELVEDVTERLQEFT